MAYKYLFSLLAILLTFIGFYPYIRGIYSGKVRPHVFSWIVWGMSTMIVFLAQLQDQAGAGLACLLLIAMIVLQRLNRESSHA